MLGPVGEALLVDGGGEEFGEAGAHRFLPRALAAKIEVGVAGEAHGGNHVALVDDFLAGEAHRLAEAQPGFDTAGVIAVAVVVEDALDPFAAHFPVRAVGKHRAILLRNDDLVVIAVGHPALNLLPRRLAGVEHDVEGVVDVVGRALVAQLGFELFGCPGVLFHHGSISMPSKATSMPAALRIARCGDASSRIGLVLLM